MGKKQSPSNQTKQQKKSPFKGQASANLSPPPPPTPKQALLKKLRLKKSHPKMPVKGCGTFEPNRSEEEKCMSPNKWRIPRGKRSSSNSISSSSNRPAQIIPFDYHQQTLWGAVGRDAAYLYALHPLPEAKIMPQHSETNPEPLWCLLAARKTSGLFSPHPLTGKAHHLLNVVAVPLLCILHFPSFILFPETLL